MQKYEREIADLLERLESEQPEPPRPIRRDRPPNLPRRKSSFGSSLRQALGVVRVSPSQLMVGGIGLVILSWLVPWSSLQQWVAVLGVLLFLGAIVISMVDRRGSSRPEKLWRGRPVEPDDRSWGDIKTQMSNAARDFKRRFRRRY